jgi:hypothetical protein
MDCSNHRTSATHINIQPLGPMDHQCPLTQPTGPLDHLQSTTRGCSNSQNLVALTKTKTLWMHKIQGPLLLRNLLAQWRLMLRHQYSLEEAASLFLTGREHVHVGGKDNWVRMSRYKPHRSCSGPYQGFLIQGKLKGQLCRHSKGERESRETQSCERAAV